VILRHRDLPHRPLVVAGHSEIAKAKLCSLIRQAGLAWRVGASRVARLRMRGELLTLDRGRRERAAAHPAPGRVKYHRSLTMVVDHGTSAIMEEIAISKFKGTCLRVLERVRKTRRPVLVTRFGKPVAQIVPPEPPSRQKSWLGSMTHTIKIQGDIVGPVSDPDEWDALR
jgi:prevent-host-death family protein